MTRPPGGGPRLLSVVSRFPSRSETFIERKARALVARGFDVTVAAHHGDRSSEAPDAPPIPVLQLPIPRDPRTWGPTVRLLAGDAGARRRAAPLGRHVRHGHALVPIAAGGFDVVHFEFSGIAALLSDLLPLLRPARLVVSCRGAAEQITPLRDPDRARRLAQVFATVDLVHCVSDDMAATVEALGAPAAKIVVNRPAVDADRWSGRGRVDGAVRGSAAAPLRLVSVGRLHWKKAFDDALRAVAIARDLGVTVEYRIAGDGPEREKLLYLRHSLGLEHEVALLGWQDQDEVAELVSWADGFLLPSLSEGISNSALEAMAAGLPVIATRCGGMHEAIPTDRAGLLVDVGATDQMASAMVRLTEPDIRRQLAAGGAAVVRADFDLSRQAAVFDEAYRSLLRDGGSGR